MSSSSLQSHTTLRIPSSGWTTSAPWGPCDSIAVGSAAYGTKICPALYDKIDSVQRIPAYCQKVLSSLPHKLILVYVMSTPQPRLAGRSTTLPGQKRQGSQIQADMSSTSSLCHCKPIFQLDLESFVIDATRISLFVIAARTM